ncbi:P-loop containing nucleoside triphosphate hydrolase protein [Mycena maculata]|uniref:P-loop containing nucleoside triphosphate hydrolase protein n=1 Tax=Mycena maculata TaxID=230809 RepID=A0AAD7MVF0_9AGAR|nr:P-loop containing nucleoside triphosphate hydrolase protein [Mycena maculata]
MQNLLDGVEDKRSTLEVQIKDEWDLDDNLLQVFAHSGTLWSPLVLAVWRHLSEPIGLAPGYSKSGKLVALAIADDTHCLIVKFDRTSGHSGGGNGGGRRSERDPLEERMSARCLLQDLILGRDAGDLVAFDLGPLSLSLYYDFGLQITNGVDIQAAFPGVDRKPLSVIKATVTETAISIFDDNVIEAFKNPFYESDNKTHNYDLALRVWISHYLGTNDNNVEIFATKVPKIDTKQFPLPILDVLAKISRDSLRLTHMKPSEINHEFTTLQNVDGLEVQSMSYNNKICPGQPLTVLAQNEDGAPFVMYGESGGVNGRTTNLNLPYALDNSKISAIRSSGRGDPTRAEAQRSAVVLRILQDITILNENLWMQKIWFPIPTDDSGTTSAPSAKHNFQRPTLNKSQQEAVDAMLSCSDRITIIQGPPGSGKTSVIAAYVKAATEGHRSGKSRLNQILERVWIWLVCKTNVAVLNIGSKLMSAGFTNWRLLGSKEFSHPDWHGHLYEGIKEYFISSKDFSKIPAASIKGCQVMVRICIFIHLSNPLPYKFTKQVPVHTIVVDEASQIEIGDYIPVFISFSSTLQKMCFIGDPKQYRMPPQIGAFISTNVYDDRLNSNPEHPIVDSTIACHFIDVVGAKEARKGNSYQACFGSLGFFNTLESEAVIKLAQHLQAYGHHYKIITPYDAQRVLIEKGMQRTDGLQWDSKVYNVDSFQGNEEDFIVISLARSFALGFLENFRRTNMMLTRFKKGMFIVSSWAFLRGPAKDCIIGKLSSHVGDIAWLNMKEVESGEFLTNPRKREV